MSPERVSALMSSRTISGAGDRLRQFFDAHPSIGSLAKVYGAITFILDRADQG
jgi:hypothetical protein